MEQRKLITMCDYIEKQSKIWQSKELVNADLHFIHNTVKYSQFLKQTPNIGHFIPAKEVDGVWIVLKEPKGIKCCGGIYNDCGCMGDLHYDSEQVEEFKEAKNRVIFEGFEVKANNDVDLIKSVVYKDLLHIWWYSNEHGYWKLSRGIKTIEDLAKFKLQLTEQKAKELGL